MNDLLEGLTEPQRQAVTHTDGPLLVLAGAGSGKTRVITRRAAYIATTVSHPRHVLAITFTNKAAGEMKERIATLNLGREMTVCTFHSLGARLLRWYAVQEAMGLSPHGFSIANNASTLSPDFTIFDEDDRRKIIKQAIAEAGLSTTNWQPAAVQARISSAKNQLLTPDLFAQQADMNGFTDRTIAKIYRIYQQLLEQQQGVDFDDLLLKTALLLGQNPDIRNHLENRFRYVLIDEYQDTNHAQYMIARGLTLKNENLCATGDPDQSIYAWRGADIRNIMEFEQDFPKAQVVRLEQNYRSTQRILSAAGTLIKANKHRKDKELWTQNESGIKVRVAEREDAEDEANFLAQEIKQHQQTGGSLSDIAVFYRINALSRVIEETFLRAGIPYQIARGTEFYNRKEIKDLLAYLRIIINPADEISWLRAINTPARGLGKTSLEKILEFAQQTNQSSFECLRQAHQVSGLKKAAIQSAADFVKLIESFRAQLHQPVETLVEDVFIRSGLKAELERESGQDRDQLDNVAELISAAADFTQTNPEGTLVEWLEQISLVSDVDAVKSEKGSVTLMTLHAAKGLEFPMVYIIAAEEGLLPHERYQDNSTDLEEERRLCFVGMTRAMKKLTLSYAKWRMIRGMTQRTTHSPFLSQLPKNEIEWVTEEESIDFSHKENLLPTTTENFKNWKVGMYFRHPAFGVGQLLWKQNSGKNTRAGVRFPAYGEKTLILEYAKMQPLDPDECQL